MICVRDNWLIGCDANMEAEELSKHIWFQKFGSAIVATEEAGTCLGRLSIKEIMTLS